MVVCYLMNQYISESVFKLDDFSNILVSLRDKIKEPSTYLFINEEINKLSIYKNDEDNFISELINNKKKELEILKQNLKKLVKGKTKNDIETEISDREFEISNLLSLLVAFLTLDNVAPVTHALGNTIKRVVIILTSVLVFGTKMTPQCVVGSSVAILGVLLYSLAKSYFK